jgi:CDP-paratose 2-epimerase
MSHRVLITGICGFVGSTIAFAAKELGLDWHIAGCDNFTRVGSANNWQKLKNLGIEVFAADLRCRDDVAALEPCDWIIDCAANPSVLSGVSGTTSTQQVMDHNLVGTIHLLEYAKRHRCGMILLSTSRVYSLTQLSSIECVVNRDAFMPTGKQSIQGLTAAGVNEKFSTTPPLSFYGTSKLASELLAMEYASAFDFPLWINRCGLLAGAGQMGKADQGIIAYWIHSYFQRLPLTYIGFGGHGHQVRDCLHPRDLLELIRMQMNVAHRGDKPHLFNVSGGIESAFSLCQLTQWCENRFGPRLDDGYEIQRQPLDRPFDVPWLVLDAAEAQKHWDWKPKTDRQSIFEEIARHAEKNPKWLDS